MEITHTHGQTSPSAINHETRNRVFFFISRIQHAAIARLFAVAVAAATKLNIYSNFFSLFSSLLWLWVFSVLPAFTPTIFLFVVFLLRSLALSLSHTTTIRNTLKQHLIIPAHNAILIKNMKTRKNENWKWRFKNEMKWFRSTLDWWKRPSSYGYFQWWDGILDTTNTTHELCFDIRVSSVGYMLCAQHIYTKCILVQCDCDGDRVCYALTVRLVVTVSIIN